MSKEAREMYARLINEKYGKLVYKIAYGILEDKNRLEDVKQEVLIRCTAKTDTLKNLKEKQLISYICVVTKHVAMVELKRKILEETMEEKVANFDNTNLKLAVKSVPFRAFEEKYGFSDRTMDLLNSMHELDKDIFLLRFYVGLTNAEVGKALNFSEEGIKKRIQRAKIKIMNELVNEEGDGFDEK